MRAAGLWGRAVFFLLIFACAQIQTAEAKIDKWADSHYDFKGIKAVYVEDIRLEAPVLSDIEEKLLMDSFWQQVNKGQPYTVLTMDAVERKISLKTFRDWKKLAAQDAEEAQRVWSAELPNFVNAYAETVLKEYRLEPYVIPAHTELRTRTVRDYYYDRDGKRHEYTHEEPYTQFIPERHTARSIIQMRFDVYDAVTRNKIFSREEYRVDNDSDDLKGMYGEIVRGCLRDFRKNIK